MVTGHEENRYFALYSFLTELQRMVSRKSSDQFYLNFKEMVVPEPFVRNKELIRI